MSKPTETSDTPTLTTLTKLEAQILQAFIWQMDSWQSQHGDKADKVEIIYYPEDEGFDVFNDEPNNGVLKRNRTTVFRADILTWATNQLKQLQGYTNENTVTAFACAYRNGEYGVAVEVLSNTSLTSDSLVNEIEPTTDTLASDGETDN